MMEMFSDSPAYRKCEARPSHVAAENVVDFDLYVHGSDDGDFALSRLDLRKPGIPKIFWTPYNGGHWVATRAAEIDTILNDSEVFGNANIRIPKEMNSNPPLRPLQVDPPEHTMYRSLLIPALAPPAVKKLGQKARALSIQLIEGFRHRGECEFVADYARIMPIGIFMSIVDLPMSDRPELIHMAELVLRPTRPEDRAEGLGLMKRYIARKVAERRAQPGDDLISRLLAASPNGKPLEGEALEGMMILLLMAGLDTVAAMLSAFARFLALNPDFRQQLIDDPKLIPGAVEELLRRFAIVSLGREVRKDVEIGGVTMKAGDMVICPTPLSNLDEAKHGDPLRVDFTRKPSPNATFGGATHRCMGSMLARTELRVFLEEWLQRIPDFTIKPGSDVKATADVTSIIPSLPLVWSVA
jgi:cytochrome P450